MLLVLLVQLIVRVLLGILVALVHGAGAGLGWAGQTETGQGMARQAWVGLAWPGLVCAGLGLAGQGKAGQPSKQPELAITQARLGRTCQNNASKGKWGKD